MEFWDIYDENKQRTGRTMKRNDWRLKEGEYHLSVLGVIRRPDGRFLITKRAMNKEWAPGWWEVPGGGVQAGEDSAVWMYQRQKVVFCFPIAGKILKKATTILWMFTGLPWTLQRPM